MTDIPPFPNSVQAQPPNAKHQIHKIEVERLQVRETNRHREVVTTYYDASNNLLRVKKEILVAMSGIQTGPAGIAGTAGDAYPPTGT